MLRLLPRLLLAATATLINGACAPLLAERRIEDTSVAESIAAIPMIPLSLIGALVGPGGRIDGTRDARDVRVGHLSVHLTASYANEVAAACRRKRTLLPCEADDAHYKLAARVVAVEHAAGDLFRVTVETVARSRATGEVVLRREDDTLVGSLLEVEGERDEKPLEVTAR